MSWQILVILFAAAGISIASRMLLRYKTEGKSFGQDGSCASLARSAWGSALYFRNETVGIIVYLCMAVLILAPYLFPQFSPLIFLLLLLFGVFLVLATVILFSVQYFVLKKWCSWYVAAGAINIILFLLVTSVFWYLP
jgi:uncharacterized membrane protein